MLLICTYARTLGLAHVAIPWPKYDEPGGSPPAFRKLDILLSAVQENLILPRGLEFVEAQFLHPTEHSFSGEVGIGAPMFDWLHTHYLSQYDLSHVLNVAKKVSSECSFTKNVMADIGHIQDVVSLHIRRTDKVRDVAVCHTMIAKSGLQELDRITMGVIRNVLDEGAKKFVICTDDPVSACVYKDFLQASGAEVIDLPEAEKHVSTYREMAVMANSKLIIQSQKSSAFSNYASCIGGVPIINVYEGYQKLFV
jgi:hypothetical protein